MSVKNKKTPIAKEVKTAVKSIKAPVAEKTEVKADDSAVKAVAPEVKKEEPVKVVEEAKPVEKPVEKPAVAEEVKPVEAKKKPGRPVGSKSKPKTTEVKKPVKKAEKEVIEEVYFEYMGEQFLSNDLVDRIKEEWKNEGHRIASIKSLRVYVSPEDRKAYYVINDKAEGKYVEF